MTTEKVYGINPKVLDDTLDCNEFYGGGYGPHGEAPFTKREQVILRNMILADLKADHHDNGDDFFAEEWVILKPVIGTFPWNKKGWHLKPMWQTMRKKAKALALKKSNSKKPELIGKVMNDVLKGIS